MKKKKQISQPWVRFLFLVYAGIMLWLLFYRSRVNTDGISYLDLLKDNINLEPFYTITNYLRVVIKRTNESAFIHCTINLVGNVVLFIPAGWMLPTIFREFQKFYKFFFYCLLIILCIEILQLFSLLGYFDVDDVILNLFGLTIGYLIFLLGKKRK